jgi:hypothetical protein
MRSFWRSSLGIFSWIGFAANFDALDVTRHLLENSTRQNDRRTRGNKPVFDVFCPAEATPPFCGCHEITVGVKATITATAARASLDLSCT